MFVLDAVNGLQMKPFRNVESTVKKYVKNMNVYFL